MELPASLLWPDKLRLAGNARVNGSTDAHTSVGSFPGAVPLPIDINCGLSPPARNYCHFFPLSRMERL